MLPNFATSREKLNKPEIQEAETPLHLCKQLLEAAEACEVSYEIFQCLRNSALL